MNEEEVKARIILPWLQAHGVALHDLSLETAFKIKVGRHRVDVSGPRGDDRVARPRLDVLVRRGSENLLVIETKAEALDLSDEDRDQAISYARLVNPIAPFALVTNGRVAHLFDTISGREVDPDTVDVGAHYSIVLPEDTRRAALRLFLDVSPANLQRICRAETESEIRALSGDVDDFGATFIPAAHVPRTALIGPLQSFLASDRSTFVVVGESGTGKTCLMVDFINHLTTRDAAIFFLRGACIEAGIVDAIGHEIEWALGGASDPSVVLRRAAATVSPNPLVIVIDGLEDWQFASRVQNLAFLIQHAANANARLVISCRSRSWPQFLATRGSRTGILEEIYLANAERPFSQEIVPWTPREFHVAVRRYRQAFGFRGGFEGSALHQAQQSPFVLRLLFQVARSHPIPYLGFNSEQFFEKYLELVLSKTSRPERSRNTLVAIAGAMFDADREWLDDAAAREALRLTANDIIPVELFEQGILVGAGPPRARRIGFAFGYIRNYLIAFYARSWPDKSPSSFGADVNEAAPDGLRVEVAAFYYPFATLAQKAVIDQNLRDSAGVYLRTYVSIIETDFPAARALFAPETSGDVGFIAELLVGRRRLGMYGFRPVQPSDERVLLVPILPVSEAVSHRRPSILYHLGASRLHWTRFSDGVQPSEVLREVLVHEIRPQLRAMLEKGRLNETGAPVLTEELVAGVLRSREWTTGAGIAPPLGPNYPISLSAIMDALRRADFRSHFEEDVIQAKREQGLIRETWNGEFVSYSPSLTVQEREAVEARVEGILRSGETITLSVRNVDRERLKRRLGSAIEHRQMVGDVITSASLAHLDELELDKRVGRRPREVVFDHCQQLFGIVLQHYRQMVETNFPTLKHHFWHYVRMPVRVVISVRVDSREDDDTSALLWCDTDSDRNEVLVFDASSVAFDYNRFTVATPDGIFAVESHEALGTHELLTGPPSPKLEYDFPGAAVRRWVYGWLRRDYDRAEAALFEMYGIRPPQ